MAPSSQDVSGSNSCKKRARSHNAGIVVLQTHVNPGSVCSSPQPTFSLAAPGQQFGFRVPGTASQTEAPTHTRFSGASSHSDSSGPPSSHTSLFLSGSGGGASTAPTSRAPSVCSSGRDRSRIPGSSGGDRQRSFQVEDLDDTAFSQPLSTVALRWTASFYGQPFNTNVSGHSLFAAPENEDLEVTLLLNENI